MTSRRLCLEGKKPRHEVVELETGRIDVAEFAILDGVMADIDSTVKDRNTRRSLNFVFPHFYQSVVYDPTITAGRTGTVRQSLPLPPSTFQSVQ
jgi:hypothetical protein